MDDVIERSLSSAQQVSLFFLRMLIGWHFLYEGYYKLVLPGWSPEAGPLGPWSSIGYLKGSTGPLASLFRRMIDAGTVTWIDRLVIFSLILVGLSLMLGLWTRLGCWGAILLLLLFYLTSVPVRGIPQPGNEGTYLLVNKNLIELAAVFVLLVFRAGEIAGLDLLWRKATKLVPNRDELRTQSSTSI